MSDPARLLLHEEGDFEAELLRSWGAEQPSEAARERALALAAGVGLGVAAAPLAAKGGAAAGGGALTWVALGAVAVAMAGGGVALYASRSARGGGVAPPRAALQAPFAQTAAPAAVTVTAAATAQQPDAASVEAVPLASPSAPRAATAFRARHDRGTEAKALLGEQVAALDRARRALRGESAAAALAALAELDSYEARFPRGALGEEAEALRVEALIAASDLAGAARIGARFLAAHPASPHAARVRSLLAGHRAP